MSAEFRGSPDDLRRVSQHLADSKAHMEAILAFMSANLPDDNSAPWGNDDIGKNFADGDSGYLAQWHWVEDSIRAKAKLLGDYSNSLRTAADTFEQQDSDV
ncbi:hypothetical protein [Mycobacterium sp. 3519A]|uniref:hypothetical protein n=1 Tax=Mycobacterium sp. 3519A TaxID=2057184 RepID=UPI000C7E5607|nr:hypothetical protein [Mycobacterium sp. 3519A]